MIPIDIRSGGRGQGAGISYSPLQLIPVHFTKDPVQVCIIGKELQGTDAKQIILKGMDIYSVTLDTEQVTTEEDL